MADHTLARHLNELGVLTLLRTQGAASRAELARKLAVTPATVTRMMSGLSAAQAGAGSASPSACQHFAA